ncbi:hypothetical protein ONE63_001662 [Megalurothrips usitatus]|uniref:Uncharacterized protein n=1 Tax=Megalurothrips usitatus TaxID=439358 RepID=A0AAV7XFB3_9NEOP|nr:hypothetical protein ONE63_001662 [Megalurothrips usitatus]
MTCFMCRTRTQAPCTRCSRSGRRQLRVLLCTRLRHRRRPVVRRRRAAPILPRRAPVRQRRAAPRPRRRAPARRRPRAPVRRPRRRARRRCHRPLRTSAWRRRWLPPAFPPRWPQPQTRCRPTSVWRDLCRVTDKAMPLSERTSGAAAEEAPSWSCPRLGRTTSARSGAATPSRASSANSACLSPTPSRG